MDRMQWVEQDIILTGNNGRSTLLLTVAFKITIELNVTLLPLETLHFVSLQKYRQMIDYKNIITIEPGKRGGKPCIRGMRITVSDILSWLAAGMTISDIIDDYDELNEEDIYAALSYAADRENRIYQVAV